MPFELDFDNVKYTAVFEYYSKGPNNRGVFNKHVGGYFLRIYKDLWGSLHIGKRSRSKLFTGQNVDQNL